TGVSGIAGRRIRAQLRLRTARRLGERCPGLSAGYRTQRAFLGGSPRDDRAAGAEAWTLLRTALVAGRRTSAREGARERSLAARRARLVARAHAEARRAGSRRGAVGSGWRCSGGDRGGRS